MDKILMDQIEATNKMLAEAKEANEEASVVSILTNREQQLTQQLSWVKQTEAHFVA